MIHTKKRRPLTKEAALTSSAATIDATAMVTRQADIPRGRAVAYPPMRGRSLWLVVSRKCPWCGSGHAHRSGMTSRLLSGRVVRVCPVWNRAYVLAPVTRGREAVRPIGVTG